MNSAKFNNTFFTSNQKYLNWFIFFSIFPLIKIAGISFSFYIFFLIIYTFLKQKKKLFKITGYADIFLIFFALFVVAAAIMTEESFRDRSLFQIVKQTFQYVYWVVIALFIKTWIRYFDFYTISKVFFIALMTAMIYYMTLNHFYLLYFPNSIAYVIVTSMPIAFYYVMKRFSLITVLLIAISIILVVLFSGSRMGTLLTIFELLLLLTLGNKKMKKTVLVLSALLLPLILVFFLSIDSRDKFDTQNMKYTLANILEDYSPKIAYSLRMEENIFERDKSWLIRELMIQKGKRIFEKHPFFGVGPGNFHYYYTHLDIIGISKWLHHSQKNYNRRSSQNSYLLILSENGIFALVSILVVFIIIFWKGFQYIFSFEKNAEIYVFIPFIGLLIYAVILVTTTGTLFWLFLGLALTLTQRERILK